MSHQHATIGDTVYFWFGANDTSGSGGDGASVAADVREAGAAAAAAPLLSPTPTLLSHADYPAGCYEIAVAATVGNGFAADDTFGVFCTLAIDSQNPTGFIGSCTLTPLATSAAQTTAQNDLDLITGADGATLATAQGNYAPNVVIPASLAEFTARSLPSADYVVVGDTIAGVTLVTTTTTNSDMRGTDGANTTVPDAAGVAPTAAEIVTAMEADGGDLSSIIEALVNKLLITEANGNAEIFNDAGASQGTVAAAYTSVAGVTQRKRIFI